MEAHRHTDTERSPSESEGDKPLRETEQYEPRRQDQIGKRQHATTAAIVDRAADPRHLPGEQQGGCRR
jgi:hypothetical protein